MDYAIETLEIELARLRRGIRTLEVTPGVEDERLSRLNRYVDELREGMQTLQGAAIDGGRLFEGFPEYAIETLHIEAGRLKEVIRDLLATREQPGIALPTERIADHRRWLEQILLAIPALESALQARLAEEAS